MSYNKFIYKPVSTIDFPLLKDPITVLNRWAGGLLYSI